MMPWPGIFFKLARCGYILRVTSEASIIILVIIILILVVIIIHVVIILQNHVDSTYCSREDADLDFLINEPFAI
jgi:hypothetical protein